MELKLNIYDGRKVTKIYTCETIDITFGVLEDVLHALNLESLKTGDKKELTAMVMNCFDQVRPFLMDLFDGVTADEIRHTRMSNLVEIFRNLYVYATNELNIATKNKKN